MEVPQKQVRKVGVRKATCSKCDGPLEETRLDKQRYCRKCHAMHMRATRPKHSELPYNRRIRANARAYANVYLRRGDIEKKPCEVCSSLDSQMHHPDYSKPKQVIWLCRKHHLELHKKG